MTLLTLTSTVSVPISRADNPDDPLNALLMGATAMPVPNPVWMQGMINDYIDPGTGQNYTPVAVDYPATLPIDYSTQTGLTDLQALMAEQPTGEPFLIEGFSMSALIAVEEKEDLAAMAVAGQQTPDVTVALFGSGNRPDGGIFERFDGLYIPLMGVDANGAEPTDLGIPTIDFAGQYDGGADFPQFPINLVSDVNAILGFLYVHGMYGEPSDVVQAIGGTQTELTGPFTDQYVLGSMETVMQQSGDTTFYLEPTADLPLLDPLRALGVPEQLLNIVQPALRVIVEAGYDRSLPLADPVPAELIPTIDPVTFLLELSNGVVQGANNAVELFGAQLPGFTDLESFFTSAESWSEMNIGVPYDQVVTELNTAFDPFTLFIDVERPVGEAIQDLLTATGIQQLADPILEEIGPAIASLQGSALEG
jgi:hypothetical protein